MIRFLTVLLLAFMTSLFSPLHAQVPGKWNLVLNGPELLKKFYSQRDTYKDSIDAVSGLDRLISKLRNAGYLEASVDSMKSYQGSLSATIHLGKAYEWLSLSKGNVDVEFLQGLGSKEVLIEGTKFNWRELEAIQEKILKNAENKGYPFAAVSLDSIRIDGENVSAKLNLTKNDLIRMDTIVINGKARVRNRFLAAYLGLKNGSLYNEWQIQHISKRISDLGFIEENGPHNIEFYNNKASLNLTLKNKRSSRFDFLVGFLPNNEKTGKLLVTGQARIQIVNPFGTGNELLIDWQKLQPRTQRLQIGLNYTYFLNLPLGFDFKFDLYKRDTLYLDLNYKAGVQYSFSGNNVFRGFYDYRSTRLLAVDTQAIVFGKTLPRSLDSRNMLYGIEYRFDNLNYRYSPTKGLDLLLSFAAGTKKVLPNTLITRLKDPSDGRSMSYLYDSLKMRSLQLQFSFDVAKYWPIKRRSTFLTALHSKALIAKNIFDNEKFRIGGNRLLRGFDEESIFTPWYAVATVEYRFLLSKNSYFYTFFDFAMVEDSRYGARHIDYPFGFGTGVALETKIGVFGINYALGRQLGNKIDFRSSKIHFGYVNYF